MIQGAIAKVTDGGSLTSEEATAVMTEIMDGEATPAQFAALVTALHLKGETVDEITAFATVMRSKAQPLRISADLVDTCGTDPEWLGLRAHHGGERRDLVDRFTLQMERRDERGELSRCRLAVHDLGHDRRGFL